MEITSTNNELIKTCAKLQQKKYRNESGKFLLEGYKAIKEAFDCGLEIENVFVDKEHFNDYQFIKDLIIETNSAVLKKISSTEYAFFCFLFLFLFLLSSLLFRILFLVK